MQGIGGYFGLEEFGQKEYHEGLIALNSGRNALLYLLKAKKIKKINIPYYLCEAISEVCIRNDYEVEHYNINADFDPIFYKTLEEQECIYIVNYFGKFTNGEIDSMKSKYGTVIIDNAHAFFQKPAHGVDTIYTCRKFFGVPDGAYLSTDARINTPMKQAVSKDRMEHILGRFERTASEYLDSFRENDALLGTEPLQFMSKLTRNILKGIDYENVKQIRNQNYSFLECALKDKNILKQREPAGPFAYPMYVKNGTVAREILATKGIYIPMLWPSVFKNRKGSIVEQSYAENILPLPCDQRYTLKEMNFIISELKKITE